MAVDLPNPLALAQDAKGQADKEIPSNGSAAAQKDAVGDREALLAKMNFTEGPDGTFFPYPFSLVNPSHSVSCIGNFLSVSFVRKCMPGEKFVVAIWPRDSRMSCNV